MSKDNSEQVIDSDQERVQPVEESAPTQNDYVARKAYEEVSTDMHKYKAKLKAEAAARAEAEAKLKAIEEAKMVEQNQFQELYEREKKAREDAEVARQQEKDLYLRSVKLSALKSELGGNVKDEYLQFANVESIEIKEDGSLSSESIQSVANQFRQDHPSLVGKNESVNITNQAAASQFEKPPEKGLNQMSWEEKARLLNEMKNRS